VSYGAVRGVRVGQEQEPRNPTFEHAAPRGKTNPRRLGKCRHTPLLFSGQRKASIPSCFAARGRRGSRPLPRLPRNILAGADPLLLPKIYTRSSTLAHGTFAFM
jgi:hypothetical protein